MLSDYRASNLAHQAIPVAIARAAASLQLQVEPRWTATADAGACSAVKQSDALWVVPGSPYQKDNAVLAAIRHAREQAQPFLGSCGGFHYAVIEYARNVLGWQDAAHGETATAGRLVITPLSCSLLEHSGSVSFTPGSRIAQAYGSLESEEGYHCRFGVDPAFSAALEGKDLRISAHDRDGDARAIEIDDHPFYLATLFQSERAALQGKLSPPVVAWLQATAGTAH